MKATFKKIIVNIFRLLTLLYLKKNKIEVIGVTGSAGKTTVKTAIGQMLKSSEVYIPADGYNTEIGLPLSVFQERIPEDINSFKGWFGIILQMLGKLIFKKAHYSLIVLEMGADHPGDIKYLTSFAKPHIAVITSVLPVHTENFTGIEQIAEEKSQILRYLKRTDLAVMNFDNEYIRKMTSKTKSQIFWIGKNKKANLYWENIKLSLDGLSVDLFWKGEKYPVNFQVIAPQLLTSIFAAVAVCLYLGYDIRDLVKKIEHFESQKGRMNLINGFSGSLIIDDSYNANPESTIAALEVLAHLPGRKIAVLGNMNELGGYEKEGHIRVGQKAGSTVQILFTIGDIAKKYIVPEASKKIKAEFVYSFDSPYKAGLALKKMIKKGDIILVKGSQNKVFAEEAIKIIMAEPEKSAETLVRQESFWYKKKNNCFKRKD